MQFKLLSFFSPLIFVSLLSDCSGQIFVTPNRTCGTACKGNLSNPYDNLLFALQNASALKSPVTIILLGNSSSEHYLLPREQSQPDSISLLYNFSDSLRFTLEDVEIRPLFCDEDLVNTNMTLIDKCVNRDQNLTVVFKPLEITLTIMKKLSIQNIIFDWSESSKSVNRSDPCVKMRTRCCNTKDKAGKIECDLKFYAKQPSNRTNTYNFIELGFKKNINKSLSFTSIGLKNFRDKTLKSFIQTNSNDPFNLMFQNSIIEDVTFGQGLVSHIGTGNETLNSSIKFSNLSFIKYNYWNRQEESDYKSWNEGYLFWGSTNFKGSFLITDSNFVDMNAASMYKCDISDPIMSNNLKTYTMSRSDIWSRYHVRNSTQESSIIYIKRLDGEMTIQRSSFQKIIGLYGSVVQVTDCSDATRFSFADNKFDSNFGMQGFANILVVAKQVRKDGRCPSFEIQNSEFTNSRGCPGSYGNVGYICYWDTVPSTTSTLQSYTILQNSFLRKYYDIIKVSQIKISGSKFQNNIIAISNSLAIVGSYITILNDNKFLDNGGTSGQILLYSLENSNFLEKKPQGWNESMSNNISLSLFGQSSVVYIDRISKFESKGNIFQRNWGPWEGSQVLAIDVTVRNWLPPLANYFTSENDIFLDHVGIPLYLTNYLVGSSKYLMNNSYTPPLITLSWDFTGANNFPFGGPLAYIYFNRAEFRNNIANYNFTDSCQYNPYGLGKLCSIMKNRARYLTGFFKFLSESELREESNTDFITTSQLISLSLAMSNTKIINNTLSTEGCLFSNVWIKVNTLNNLTIYNNKILPFVENPLRESSELREPFLDFVMENRNGLFCSFEEKILKQTAVTKIFNPSAGAPPIFTVSNLMVFNNIGTIFNFFPEEINNLQLMNSIFVNNTCTYGSTIQTFAKSKALTTNNIFIGNNNFFGIFFISSSDSLRESIFNTYIKNNGKHASLVYLTNYARAKEILLNSYWNTINPTFKTFIDQTTPQGGLYYSDSSQLSFVLADFRQNEVYAGILISLNSDVSFCLSNFSDHYIYGNNVVGSMYSSIVSMKQVRMINNSFAYIPSLQLKSSLIVLEKTRFIANELKIINNLNQYEGSILLGTKIQGSIVNMSIENFRSTTGEILIKLESSYVTIKNLDCENITSLFKLSRTQLNLINISIRNLVLSPFARFLMHMVDSTLKLNELNYIGASDSGTYFSLFTGSKNSLEMLDSNFLNAVVGINKIFELTYSVSVFIAKSAFRYTNDVVYTTVFDLTSSHNVRVQECIFILVGKVFHANLVLDELFFFSNTIISNSHLENIQLINTNVTYLVDNFLLQENNNNVKLPPGTQISIQDSFGDFFLQNNILLSLSGLKGVINVQSLTNPYNINSSSNIFIDNTGSCGGVFHLDVSLPSSLLVDQTVMTPTITIVESVFVLNKALSFQEKKGKGGVIYQTTSTMANQSTIIKKSLFLKNSAETMGGAIFFDYLPPQIDEKTKFLENYAKKPNHIGSYPVKLVYFGDQILDEKLYLPNNQFKRILQINKVFKWENITSGNLIEKTFAFGLVDMFGQIVYDDNFSLLQINPEGIPKEYRHFFSSKNSIRAKNGLYLLSNFKFSHKVDGYTNVTFTSSAIENRKQIFTNSDTSIELSNSIIIQVYFRKCGLGEHVLTEHNITTCEECQPGFWQTSPDPNIPFCKPCSEKSTICLGRNQVGPKKGYWRLNETADIILSCPRADSCLGNDLDIQNESVSLDPVGKCEYGHTGNLCSNCISGWVKAGNGSCVSCKANAWSYIRLTLILSFQLGLVIQGYRETRTLSIKYSENKATTLKGAILIRIFTNYLQLTSLVSKLPITWPMLIKSFFIVATEASSIDQNVFNIDCIFDSGELFGIRLVFIRLVIESAGAFIMVFMSIIFWILYFAIRRIKIFGSKRFTSTITTTAIVILFIMQPSAVQSSFSFFQCINLYREDTPIEYFSKDYDLKCWEGEHLYWALGFGLPSLLLWSLILPFLIYRTIKKNKDKLNTKEVSQIYSFLYAGYTESRYYWELVVMITKFIFIAIVISASFHSSNLQIYFAILTIISFYGIHIIGRPFSDPQLDLLKRISLLNASVINFCGLYFQLNLSKPPQLDIFVTVIGLTTNLIFLLAFVRLYFWFQMRKLKENRKIYEILIKLFGRFRYCLKFKKSAETTENIQVKESKRIPSQPDEVIKLTSEVCQEKRILTSPSTHEKIIVLDQAFSRSISEIFSSPDILNFDDVAVNEEKDRKEAIQLKCIKTKQMMRQGSSFVPS